MATLQKFKLLAGSPTRSPVIHLRRRKTLRMFLNGSVGGRRLPPSDDSTDRRGNSPEKVKELAVVRHRLKDLFVSSPPLEEKTQSLPAATARAGSRSNWRRVGPHSLRPFSAAFRQRLLRRAWRPVLVTIPE